MEYPLNLSGVGDLRSIAEEIIAVLRNESLPVEEKKSLLCHKLRPVMDFDSIAHTVLGIEVRKPTDAQFERYRAVMSEYVLSSLSRFFANNPAEKISVIDIVAADGVTTVVSEVSTPDGETLEWLWHLKRAELGYRIVDIEVHDISLANFLRSEVESTLRLRDFEGLLETLHSRL